MKIRVADGHTLGTSKGPKGPGSVLELPDQEAKGYIARGVVIGPVGSDGFTDEERKVPMDQQESATAEIKRLTEERDAALDGLKAANARIVELEKAAQAGSSGLEAENQAKPAGSKPKAGANANK